MKKNIINKQILDILIQVIGILVNLEILYILFNLTQYSSFSSTIFLVINGVGLLLLILIDIAIIMSIRKNSKKMDIVILIVFVFFIIFSTVTAFVINRVNQGVDNIIVNPVQTETVFGAFITYKSPNIQELEDINGKKFGIISSTEFLQGNSLAKEQLEKNNISVDFVEYGNYNDLYLGLLAGEVDVAAMPDDFYRLFIVNEGYEEYLDETVIIYDYQAKVDITSVSDTDFDVTKTPFTVLIMGNDGSLSDTLIVATFNPYTFKATLTSIARDSYVPIACYTDQASDKITHARVISRQCTIDTVQNLLDIKIDFFAEVNFTGVVEIVDAMGGLFIDSPITFVGQSSDPERGHFTVWVPAGKNYLSGEQTLAFARERKLMPGGDYQRQLNQQQVIKQLLNQMLATKDVNVLLNVLDAASSNIKTNMSLKQMMSLFNYSLSVMNNSFVDSEKVLDLQGSRITGYGSTNYNEVMELPLWIYRLFNGAIEDNRNFILNNLAYDYEPEVPADIQFNIGWWIVRPVIYQEEYDEQRIHDVIPDIMPNMLSTNDSVWTYERVKSWAKERNITLTLKEIKLGDALYSETYVHNQIVTQSEKYGRRTSKITNLTIGVIKKVLDCSIYDFRVYEECQDIVEDFIWNTELNTYPEIVKWASLNNVKLEITWLNSEDGVYVVEKIHKVFIQETEAYKKIPDNRVVKLQVFDYPFVEIPKVDWTKAQLDEFISKLVSPIDQVTIIKEYSATKAEGTVLKVEPTYIERYLLTKKFRTNDKITITVSTTVEPTITVPSFIGLTQTDLQAWLTEQGLTTVTITVKEEVDPANIGKIKSIIPNINGTDTYKKSTFPTEIEITIGKAS
jgi:polyisoprenyl-teichoic acid--peptidoglycan teichoic acid transferase